MVITPAEIITEPMVTQADTFQRIVTVKYMSTPVPIYLFRQPVRQLRHHFGPLLAHILALHCPARAVLSTQLCARARRLLIDACNLMLSPIP